VIGIDTNLSNVLVRYIAQDDPVQSPLASELIERECTSASPGYIGIVALVELAWVSESCYGATRGQVADILRRILSIRQLVVQEAELVWKALRLFEFSSADFADSLIERTADAAGCTMTVTFDRKAAGTGGMRLLESG
jgi:predicted nucleic-acid-binding protein